MKSKIQILFGTFVFSLSTFFFAVGSYAQWGGDGWHNGPGMMGGWGMGWFGPIFMVVFWGLVITGLVLFIRWLVQGSGRGAQVGSESLNAIEILKERYARGEIDREEFEQKKQDLMK